MKDRRMRSRSATARGTMGRVRKQLTYANVMATLAVFGVLAGGGAYAASKIGADDIANNAVRSRHVKSYSLDATDLGVRLWGGRQPNDGPGQTCGTGTAFSTCVFLGPLKLPRAQRLLLLGSGEWYGYSSDRTIGECRVGVGAEYGEPRRFGHKGTIPSNPFNFSINTVTGVIPAGSYELSLECRELAGEIEVWNSEFSVAAVGAG